MTSRPRSCVTARPRATSPSGQPERGRLSGRAVGLRRERLDILTAAQEGGGEQHDRERSAHAPIMALTCRPLPLSPHRTIACMVPLAIVCRGPNRIGALHAMTGVIQQQAGDIVGIDIVEGGARSAVYFEIEGLTDDAALIDALLTLDVVDEVDRVASMRQVYGKRIIVVGGGAQVGQVAIGAISEADRHNIRGEKISVDTIPIVGERELAEAVRAVARLPRAVAVVLAGSLMGGEITKAVREVRAQGILVVSLNMPGSAPREADLVVTDPVQAGVMTVMAVARTARFDIARQRGRTY